VRILNICAVLLVGAILVQPLWARETAAPQRERATLIFQRLLKVADIPINIKPVLDISGFAKDSPEVDRRGRVKLPPSFLEKCYDKGANVGDSRLAFILGHELAHIALKHNSGDAQFSSIMDRVETRKYEEAYKFAQQYKDPTLERLLKGLKDSQELSDPQKVSEMRREIDIRLAEIRKGKELEADHNGIFYMMTVGYDPMAVVGGEVGFVKEVVLFLVGSGKEVSSEEQNLTNHPIAETRQEKLAAFVTPVMERFELFRTAKRYYQIGDYETSQELLKDLIHSPSDPTLAFYTKEVFNNLGMAYFQMAIVPDVCEKEYHVWYLPSIIESALPQDRERDRGTRSGTLSCQQEEKLKHNISLSVDAYNTALKLDPGYEAARLNLATALLMMGELDKPTGIARELLKENPGHVMATNILAIAGFKSGVARHTAALAVMRTLLAKNPGHAASLYNLARMLQITGQKADAGKYWKRFVKENEGTTHAFFIQRELGTKPGLAELTAKQRFRAAEAPAVDVRPRTKGREVRKLLQAHIRREFSVKVEEAKLEVLHGDATAYVLLNDTLQFVEKTVSGDAASVDRWVKKYGQPQRKIRQNNGWVYVYNGFGIEVVDGKIKHLFWFDATT
jgi:tetratricopeptide (TPR) repeat protein